MKNRLIDLLILIIVPIFTSILSLYFHFNTLLVLVFIFFPVIFYLSLKRNVNFKNLLIFVFFTTIPIGVMYDIFGIHNLFWYTSNITFNFRLYGVPFEDILWIFSAVFIVPLFYEYMYKENKNFEIKKLIYYFGTTLYILMLIFLFVFSKSQNIFYLGSNYYFITALVFFGIPGLLFLLFNLNKFKELFITNLYGCFIFFLMEFVQTKNGNRIFPSDNFIGWFTLWGSRFPIEELIFVVFFCGFTVLSYYFVLFRKIDEV